MSGNLNAIILANTMLAALPHNQFFSSLQVAATATLSPLPQL